MKPQLTRCQAQENLDRLLQLARCGGDVSAAQIAEADSALTEVADYENVACLKRDHAALRAQLRGVESVIAALNSGQQRASKTMRALLHKADENKANRDSLTRLVKSNSSRIDYHQSEKRFLEAKLGDIENTLQGLQSQKSEV